MKATMGFVAALVAVAFTPTVALAAEKSYDVDPFTEIEISSGIDATISIGDVQSVVAESPNAAELDEMIVEVRGGRFHAYVDWSVFDIFALGADRRIHLTITVPAVAVIDSNSGSDVTASNITGDRLRLTASSGADLTVRDVAAETVELEASSGADLSASGTCGTADAGASSGADLDARDLVCRSVDVEASSGAGATVHATEAVDAEASSGANVDVYGNPTNVRDEDSSGGDITIR